MLLKTAREFPKAIDAFVKAGACYEATRTLFHAAKVPYSASE